MSAGQTGLSTQVTESILKLVTSMPTSDEQECSTPDVRARVLARAAARTSAGISGGAALVPGPFGLLSLLPEMFGVWRVQAQLVSDIAAVYGKTATLSTEQMV